MVTRTENITHKCKLIRSYADKTGLSYCEVPVDIVPPQELPVIYGERYIEGSRVVNILDDIYTFTRLHRTTPHYAIPYDKENKDMFNARECHIRCDVIDDLFVEVVVNHTCRCVGWSFRKYPDNVYAIFTIVGRVYVLSFDAMVMDIYTRDMSECPAFWLADNLHYMVTTVICRKGRFGLTEFLEMHSSDVLFRVCPPKILQEVSLDEFRKAVIGLTRSEVNQR